MIRVPSLVHGQGYPFHTMNHDPLYDDRELVRAVLCGDTRAFERLVQTYQRLCWHIVGRMVRNSDDVRDLCQETFLRAYQQLHQFRFECPLKSWIGRIAFSIALRHLERERRSITLDAEAADELAIESSGEIVDIESVWIGEQRAATVRAAVDALPPMLKTLLSLYYLEELSITQIAQITDMSAGTIKSHLFRARARLREWLERRGVREP